VDEAFPREAIEDLWIHSRNSWSKVGFNGVAVSSKLPLEMSRADCPAMMTTTNSSIEALQWASDRCVFAVFTFPTALRQAQYDHKSLLMARRKL
jgi:hypothetical protein